MWRWRIMTADTLQRTWKKWSACLSVHKILKYSGLALRRKNHNLKNVYPTAQDETLNSKFRSDRQADICEVKRFSWSEWNIKYFLPGNSLPQTSFTSQIVMFKLKKVKVLVCRSEWSWGEKLNSGQESNQYHKSWSVCWPPLLIYMWTFTLSLTVVD